MLDLPWIGRKRAWFKEENVIPQNGIGAVCRVMPFGERPGRWQSGDVENVGPGLGEAYRKCTDYGRSVNRFAVGEQE